jgi:diguanylate cyclase (GGDEF)-like protein
MSQKTAFQELKLSGKLPSPSGVALKLVQLMQKDTVTIQEVANLVQLDPALTGRLIQAANTAFAHSRRPVAAITDAIALLGMNTVRQLTLGLSISSNYRKGECAGFDYDAFWAGSLARALAAQAIATRHRSIAAPEAFTCGLLSEIGKLALATAYPTEYATCLSQCATGDDEVLLSAEQQQFAIDHRQITQGLLADWGFPVIFLDAIRHQILPGIPFKSDNSRMEQFAAQLRFSSLLGRFCTAEPDERHDLLSQIGTMGQLLGMATPDVAEVWAELLQQWRTWSPLLNIESITIPPLEAASVPESPEIQGGGLKILLVDSDQGRRVQTETKLKQEGYTTHVANTVEQGLKRVVEEHPELVLLEWQDDGAGVLKFCKSVREMDPGVQSYLVILAPSEQVDLQAQALDAGIDAFLVKPVPDQVLWAQLRAGKRMIQVQRELAYERETVRRYASDLAVANRRLELQAMTDTLTRIPNRRYAFKRLEEEWGLWLRTHHPLAVMVLDLDHFKAVNDTYGHKVGDQILAQAAKIIRSILRTCDVLCRLGGEEFIVIAPNTDRKSAAQLGERVRAAVEGMPSETVRLKTPLTISVGIAVSHGHIANCEDLLQEADKVLYQAKNAGRNRVCLSTGARQP